MSCSPKLNVKRVNHKKKEKHYTHNHVVAAYQSPIALPHDSLHDVICIDQQISIYGENIRAIYNHEHKIYEVQDVIVLRICNKKYQLEEYHFHIPGEHKVNDQIYESEIHYVFVELDHDEDHKKTSHKCSNVCGNMRPEDNRNILVIGRVINHKRDHEDLSRVQVRVPHSYFEYDGSLTTGEFSPVRWIIGNRAIHFNLNDVECVAKGARPIQPFDHRIILFSNQEKEKKHKCSK